MSPKNENPRCASTLPRARTTWTCGHYSEPVTFRLAPLLPPADAPPIPEDFWLIHRYRKGGVR